LFDNAFGNAIGNVFLTSGGDVGGTAMLFDFTTGGNSGLNLGGIWAYPSSGADNTRRMKADAYVSYNGTSWVYVGQTDGFTKTTSTSYDVINIPKQPQNIKKLKFTCLQHGGDGYYMGELVFFQNYASIVTNPIVVNSNISKILLETQESTPVGSSGIKCEISFDDFVTSQVISKNLLFTSIPSGATSFRIKFTIEDLSELQGYSLSWG
jgi:hypothetical protein